MGVVLIIIVIVILSLLSAFFSCSETAFLSANMIRIKQFAKSSKKGLARIAKRVLKIEKNASRFISTILVSNNIVNILGASLSTYLFTTLLEFGEKGVLYATVAFSIFIIVFGEILPKILARAIPEKIALYSSGVLNVLVLVLTPITALFTKIDKRINERFEEEQVTATENELLDIVETIEKEGVLEHNESELIQSAITFDDISVKTAMTPREKVVFVSSDSTFDEVAKTFVENRYSRIPVYDKEKDSIIGIIYQRDVFENMYKKKKDDVNDLIKESLYISHRRLLPYALEQLQKNKSHIAIVVDNLKDKRFLGIITLEDVLEELVGEIYDEYDELPKSVFEIGNHMYRVNGKVLLEDLFDDYLDEVKIPKTKEKTVDGWIKELVDDISRNDIIYYENLKISISSLVDGNVEYIEIEVLTDYSEEE